MIYSIEVNKSILLCLGFLIVILFVFRPNSILHTFTVKDNSLYKSAICIVIAAVIVVVCVLPMGKLPLWNGEIPEHRNQYELMAEAILDGRIEFSYGDEESLRQLENPYDPDERRESQVVFHYDHAYYDGHYYMYFGIVPVFLLFIPYLVLTGSTLVTYHATQIFVLFAIIGIFALFHLLSTVFFEKLSYSIYLSLASVFSIMSVWYSTAEPALYCTAITSAIALEIWSLYFFIKAVWKEQNENRQIIFAGIGSMLGALVFGCRPPIALANILVIPMLVVFLKRHKFTLKLFCKLFLAALPYVVVAAALMWYNYARFADPFEFGQAYQLTSADQTSYNNMVLDLQVIPHIVNELFRFFFESGNILTTFPYLHASSVFYNFPILLLGIGIVKPKVLKNIQRANLLFFVIILVLAILIIVTVDILWSPLILERYRMDIYFLMGILCFIIIGFWYNSCSEKWRTYFCTMIIFMSVITLVSVFLLYVDTIGVYYPENVTEIANYLGLK